MSFDLCCPGNGAKAPDSPAKVYQNDDERAMSDEESYGPPQVPPPPPSDPHPDDQYNALGLAARQEQHPHGDKFTDEYDDTDRTHDMEKGSDPPQETNTSAEYTDDEDVDFEEDQSVEIPPTQVVERMLGDEDGSEKERRSGGSTLLLAGCVACCLVVAALVLGIGFGTGAFTKEKSSSSAVEPANPTDDGVVDRGDVDVGDGSGSGTGGSGGGGNPTPEPPVVIPDLEEFSGLTLTEFIPSISLADPSVFENVESPEYLAMLYLQETNADTFDTSIEADRTRLTQMYSLLTLWYSSTDAWEDETGWTVSNDECSWAGVFCEEGIVTEIDMESNGLTGTLPPDLARLDSVKSLTLSNNNIMGPLPRSLFVMSNLEEIYLENNLFDDELTNVSGLTSLTVFFASNNDLSGDISVFWTLPQLLVLVVDNNSFSGTLSGISAMENMSK